MKIVINGHRFDAAKAKKHYTLEAFDDRSNRVTGDVYLSSKGQWYLETPSQWANGHYWMLSTAAEILSEYGSYLTESEKAEIATLGDGGKPLDWE